MSYTPGPWSHDGLTVYALNEQRTNRFCVHVFPGHIPGHDDEETQQANVRLIATAPELLEALEDFIETVEHVDPSIYRDTIDNAKQVIAKVKDVDGERRVRG
jgi:hypothetical protein